MSYLVELSLDELRVVGAALAEQPYRVSAPVIAKINEQVVSQQAAEEQKVKDGKG